MKPDIYYGIAAYNEENNIESCLESLSRQNFKGAIQTIICLNGCTDKTEEKVLKATKTYPSLNIQITHSNKGIAFAQNKIIQEIKYKNTPLIFIDADVTLHSNCIDSLYDEIKKNKGLKIVGAWPKPKQQRKLNIWKKLLFLTLHIRAQYPEAEISKYNVIKYKDFVDKNPQKTISKEFEKKSKIYFHGRTFLIKNPLEYEIPKKENICDDTYMSNFIHNTYGPGTIRTRYDAIVYYKPYLSLREHFKIYRRIFLDLRNLDSNIQEFSHIRKLEQTKLDWNYILKQKSSTILFFITYVLISTTEKITYKMLPKKTLDQMWQYSKK